MSYLPQAHWERVVKPHNEHTRRALLSLAADQQPVLGQAAVEALAPQAVPSSIAAESVLPPVPQAAGRDIVTYAPRLPVSPTATQPAAAPSPSHQLQPSGQLPLQAADGSAEFDIGLVVPAYERVFGLRPSQPAMQPQVETVQVILVQVSLNGLIMLHARASAGACMCWCRQGPNCFPCGYNGAWGCLCRRTLLLGSTECNASLTLCNCPPTVSQPYT